ncbi:MAG: cellulose biosynthesis cyclic di-GMP-binding regulatory protein BcsB, partial [Stenotrophomonas nitritireducens]|nr:cellulose biosynthesis cyclic di-GMP-binding regulatory protein BcsB [Stenotrophomonas nitritireducens]
MKHCLHTPLIPAARARCASLAFALALVAGAAHAQAPASMPPPPGLQAEPTAAAQPAPGLPLQRSRSTLKQLGLDYEVTLRGIQGTAGIPFSIRSDQVVDHAALHLKYTYSPALLPDLSHLRVTVNDVTVATLPVSVEEAGRPVERDVAIDPRLVTDYNRVNLQLIGHYTRECEDPDHTSLWANIDSASYLELGWLPLPLSNDLALLPVPFFDSRDTRRLELPFVFAGQPANGQLQAAGIVSSWFGALAGYRGAMFPVSTGALPARGNAVVVATPRNLPAGLALPEVAGPMLAVLSNPNDAGGKLLLVLGRDDAELRAAATALALGAPLSGASATLRDVKEAA